MSAKWSGQDLHDWTVATNGARRVREYVAIFLFLAAFVALLLLCGCAVDVCGELRSGASLMQTSDAPITFNLMRHGAVIRTVSLEDIARCGR